MKNSIKKSIIFMAGLFSVIGYANAASIGVASTETEANVKNNSVDVSISDSDVNLYNKIEFELSLSGTTKADLKDFSPAAGLEYKNLGNNKFSLTKTGGLVEGKIGTIYFVTDEELSENFTITPVNVKFFKESGEEVAASKVTAGTIKYKSPARADAYLTSLEVSQGTLSPEFNKDVTEYEVTVPESVSIIKITANPCTGAVREGSGNKALQLGENEINIVVTAEDKKTTKTYKIVVTRGDSGEPSAFIKELTIKNENCKLSPEFDSKNNKYTITAPHGTEKLDLEFTLEEKAAKLEINGNENFKDGENKVTLKVTASDNSATQEYVITVNVEEEKLVTPSDDVKKEEPTKKVSKKIIILLIAIIIVLIIGITSVLLFRKKKNKKAVNTITKNEETNVNKVEYEEQKTTTYDLDSFKEAEPAPKDEEDIDKTKEFYF